MTQDKRAVKVLIVNTVAFTICFMCWMTNGVLITYLVENGVFRWSASQIGWLIGIPVLTGSLVRLPVGILTDKYGGRIVYGILLLFSAIPMFMLSTANSFTSFLLWSLGFGVSGASFAVGIAYTSVWFPKESQGTALGIFGAGNAGSAITSLFAPRMLNTFTEQGANIEGWRTLPKVYAAALLITGILFFLTTHTKLAPGSATKTLKQRLEPLKYVRVWRFGLYYFLVFGGFVALAQWLIPYYVNAYTMSVATAGLMASIFSLPSGVIRALGGWLSDKFGARATMQWVLLSCILSFALLIVPRMDIWAPGSGIMAKFGGTVKEVTPETITVLTKSGDVTYKMKGQPGEPVPEEKRLSGFLVFPKSKSWQEPVVTVGQEVKKKELLAKGVTHIYFQANVWIFTILVFIIGIAMGIGKAAVYKYIPDYFPTEVGVVGGIVGVIGGLGGFFCPIIFGYLLDGTGLWTTCWMFFFGLTAACILWMHLVIRGMMKREAPAFLHHIEDEEFALIGNGHPHPVASSLSGKPHPSAHPAR